MQQLIDALAKPDQHPNMHQKHRKGILGMVYKERLGQDVLQEGVKH